MLRTHPCAAAAVLAAGCLLPAQTSQNTTLLSRTDVGVTYAAVWGYTAPDYREYAILGERTATVIYDVTDPTAPAQVGSFAAPASDWREMTSYRHHVYSVSEHHSGVRVIDLSNPAAPVDRGYKHTTLWANAHSIHCDPDTGRIYVNGSSSGMHVLDAAADPVNLPALGRWASPYVHDCYVRRGRGYLAEVYNSRLRIVNASNAAALTTLSQIASPQPYTHNAWVSDDDRLLLVTHEDANGYVKAYDVTNPAAPVPLANYASPGHILHNVYGIGRTGYVAAYTDGFHMIDLSTPGTSLRRIAYYDTSTVPGNNYDGVWGVYPWADSGVIYASDISNGLYCLRVDAGHVNRYGLPTAGGSRVPRLHTEGSAVYVGASALRARITGLAAGAPWLLLLSPAQGTQQVLGTTVHVALAGAMALSGTADAQGNADVPLPIPGQPGLAGARVYAQVFAADGAAPQGVSASRGHWFGIAP